MAASPDDDDLVLDPDFDSFKKELDDFHKLVLPVLRERHKANKECDFDLTASSDLYIFVGNGFYAVGQTEGRHSLVSRYNCTCELSEKIRKEVDRQQTEGTFLSTFHDDLRLEVILRLQKLGYRYNGGVAYDNEFTLGAHSQI